MNVVDIQKLNKTKNMRFLTFITVLTFISYAGITNAQNTIVLYDTISPKMGGCDVVGFPNWILDIDCLPMNKEMMHYEKYSGTSILGVDTTSLEQMIIYSFHDDKLMVMAIYQKNITIHLMKNYISIHDKRGIKNEEYCTTIGCNKKRVDFVNKFIHLLPDRSILEYVKE